MLYLVLENISKLGETATTIDKEVMKAVLAVFGLGLVLMVPGSIGEENDDSKSNIQVMSILNF